jgi:hypothetical protein
MLKASCRRRTALASAAETQHAELHKVERGCERRSIASPLMTDWCTSVESMGIDRGLDRSSCASANSLEVIWGAKFGNAFVRFSESF